METQTQIVDADVHAVIQSIEDLMPYLAPNWQEYATQSAFDGPLFTAYPQNAPTSWLADSDSSASTEEQFDHLIERVFVRRRTTTAILNCAYAVESVHNPDVAKALSMAANDWLIDQWLTREPRLRGSLIVPSHLPDAAAGEIDRLGAHPQIVQVTLPVRSRVPYGNRFYLPLFQAAVRNDLVVGVQFGGAPGNAPTGSGWPSTYVEEYVGMASTLQCQLMSMVVEGLFVRFPTLRVGLVECGFSWLPTFLWRLDKDWKALRREVPWTDRKPSEYVRDHVRATMQPFDAPASPSVVTRLLDQIGSDEFLMYASDDPHAHDLDGEDFILSGFADQLAAKMLAGAAKDFYRV